MYQGQTVFSQVMDFLPQSLELKETHYVMDFVRGKKKPSEGS